MPKFLVFNRKEIFLIGTICLIIATISITIASGIYNSKISYLEREYEKKMDEYEESNILLDNAYNYRYLIKRIDLLEISILLATKGVFINRLNLKEDSNIVSHYNKYFTRSYINEDSHPLSSKIGIYLENIDLYTLQTKRDSLKNLKNKINDLNIPNSKKDSLLLQVFNKSEKLYDTQQEIKSESLIKRWDRISNLHGIRMAFYSVFILCQVFSLILLGYSQIMKDNK